VAKEEKPESRPQPTPAQMKRETTERLNGKQREEGRERGPEGGRRREKVLKCLELKGEEKEGDH
jgi:hypothetical protein